MKIDRMKTALLVAVLMLGVSATSFASTLYLQTFDGVNVLASQNDTGGGNGNFATAYDNFVLGTTALITDALWTGGYFNPPAQGTITGFTVNFYADNAGQPGTLLSTNLVAGTAGEAFLGNFAGFQAYTYSFSGLNFLATAGTSYWMSVVPDVAFPPQWGWATASGGDGLAYQDFFGTRSPWQFDLAFELRGNVVNAVPEPASLTLLGLGLAAIGARQWRRRRA